MNEQIQYGHCLKSQIEMFGTNMRTVEKEAIESRIEREAQLT